MPYALRYPLLTYRAADTFYLFIVDELYQLGLFTKKGHFA